MASRASSRRSSISVLPVPHRTIERPPDGRSVLASLQMPPHVRRGSLGEVVRRVANLVQELLVADFAGDEALVQPLVRLFRQIPHLPLVMPTLGGVPGEFRGRVRFAV